MSVPILEKIRQAENLPSLPTVAIQVLKMTQSENMSVAHIATVIQKDPALTSKILRMANSSLFGMSRKISSLQQATVVLGLRTLKAIVLSFSLVDLLGREQSDYFDYRRYWRRSLTEAVVARLLAEKVQRSIMDESFVGGLLSDIGILAAVQCAQELYYPALALYRESRQSLQTAEQQILGVTHETISANLLDHWGLPEDLCEAVRTHHQSLTAPTPYEPAVAQLTRILRSASQLADVFVEDTHAGHLQSIQTEIMQGLDVSESVLETLLKELDSHVNKTAALLSLNIGDTISYREIQANAMTQLAQLTMTAEIERAQSAKREQEAQIRAQALDNENRQLAVKAATDGLTGIPNRLAFEQRLRQDCAKARKQHLPIGLILMDLDRFKRLNDTYGHQTGDAVLRMVGGVLKQCMTETQFAARYGGEEFTLIVTGATVRELCTLAEVIRLNVAKLLIPFDDRYLQITASLGVAYMKPDDPDLKPRPLFRQADQYLYEAKNNGRNRVVCIGSRQPAVQH
jgi:diguanylate cyclase (GGDEF)-like protein